MASAVDVEVWVFCVPLLIFFLLLILPVPLLSCLVSQVTLIIHRIKIGPVPVLIVLLLVMTVLFARSLLSYSNEFVDNGNTEFTKEIFHVEYKHKRALHERNMYIHVLGAVLGFAILKIASLTLKVKEIEDKATVSQLQAALPCFHNAPKLSTEEAITAAMMQLTEAPEHRPDLGNYLPDADDTVTFIEQLRRNSAAVYARSRPLIDACGLSEDEVKILVAYKMDTPYNFYKWFNAWLTGARRAKSIVNTIGPAFTLLYRAQEKLPVVTKKCGRGIEVGTVPTLMEVFTNFKTHFAPGSFFHFWGLSSFSTDDKVVNKFMAAPDKDSIVYTCGKLTGVQMDPFAPGGMATEAEILPLAPSLFRVVAVIKVHRCVLVTVEQQNSIGESYVVPTKSN